MQRSDPLQVRNLLSASSLMIWSAGNLSRYYFVNMKEQPVWKDCCESVVQNGKCNIHSLFWLLFLAIETDSLKSCFRTCCRFEGVATLMQGRGKMQVVLVIVLSDVLFFLLENNHKYSFFTPDNKVVQVFL